MLTTTCPCCGQTLKAKKLRPLASPVNTADMTTAQLYAHYKKTAPVEDVRFMLRVAKMSKELRADVTRLLADGESGLKPADVRARYLRLDERWRVEAHARERSEWFTKAA